MKTVYVVTRGEYSDYSFECAFETEQEARDAVAGGLGDDVREMKVYGVGERPTKVVVHCARWIPPQKEGQPRFIDPFKGQELHVWSFDSWSHEVGHVSARPAEFMRYPGGGFALHGTDREAVIKAASDRRAKALAESLEPGA